MLRRARCSSSSDGTRDPRRRGPECGAPATPRAAPPRSGGGAAGRGRRSWRCWTCRRISRSSGRARALLGDLLRHRRRGGVRVRRRRSRRRPRRAGPPRLSPARLGPAAEHVRGPGGSGIASPSRWLSASQASQSTGRGRGRARFAEAGAEPRHASSSPCLAASPRSSSAMHRSGGLDFSRVSSHDVRISRVFSSSRAAARTSCRFFELPEHLGDEQVVHRFADAAAGLHDDREVARARNWCSSRLPQPTRNPFSEGPGERALRSHPMALSTSRSPPGRVGERLFELVVRDRGARALVLHREVRGLSLARHLHDVRAVVGLVRELGRALVVVGRADRPHVRRDRRYRPPTMRRGAWPRHRRRA